MMNIDTINEGAQMIAPAYLHPALRSAFLSKKSAVSNIRISTLSTFLSEGTKTNDESIYKYYSTLKDFSKHLQFNKNNATSFSYIQEVMAFINDMKQYHISLESLPQSNPFEREIKNIIKALLPIETQADIQKKQISKRVKNTSFENVFIIDEAASLYEESIYRCFCAKGATRIHEDAHLQNKKFFHALNRRQEVESAAQYIIKNKIKAEDIKISIFETSYLNEIKRIFAQYKIPCYAIEKNESSDLLQRFITLIEYFLNPDSEPLKKLFINHVFSHTYENHFIQYIDLHHFTLHDQFEIMKDVTISEDVLSKREVEQLRKLENNASLVKAYISPFLEKLSSFTNYYELLIYIDEFLCTSFPFDRMEDRRTLLMIREEIKKSKPYLSQKEDLLFFSTLLKEKKTALERKEKGVTVTSFHKPLPSYPYHIVLGCTQDNFPNFNAKKGIFDENYYQNLQYPSIQERYEFHLQKQKQHLTNSKTLLCFAPLSTIDGKACETSLEIETFMEEKAILYPLETHYQKYSRTYELKEETAKKLFLKEHEIHGSISSFERYMNCPYSYFLRYGLRLEENVDYTFNNAKSGILSHLIMEILVKRYGKAYTQTKEEEVASLLHERLAEIAKIYPYEEKNLIHMEKRLLENIALNLEILQEQEIHSSLTPKECEYHFDYRFSIDENNYINLHGVIDRIDTNQDFLRVIDYKSSDKQLKEELVFAALQLQLITYLIIAQKRSGKRPLGAMYYSFAIPNISASYAKLKKRPLTFITFDQEDHKKNFLKEGRMNGWICDENIEAIDDTGSHIVGVRNSKASGINASTIYQFDTLEQYFNELYKIIGNRILDGNIQCESASGACTYCPYGSICANANRPRPKEELIEVDASLYLKGGRKNA